MAWKFSNEPLLNASGEPIVIDLKRGNNTAYLHDFARFGMLSAHELKLLYGLHLRSAFRITQGFRATNNGYIDNVDYQRKLANRMGASILYYDLTKRGKDENEARGVPNYEPIAGSDFDHRVMTVQWLVSFHAGVRQDKSRDLIEWPEIRARLPKNFHHGVLVDDSRVQTDSRPFGVYNTNKDTYIFTRSEIDCGTEQYKYSRKKSSTIENKIVTHTRIARDRLFKSLGIPNDFIPFVAQTEERKESIKDHIRGLIEKRVITPADARTIGVGVFKPLGRDEVLTTKAYTMPYERVGHPDFYFNA